ncbi:hypothetical protein STEG23_022784 [Scotinomys teguina]
MKPSSGQDRRESHNSWHWISSPEDRNSQEKWSGRKRFRKSPPCGRKGPEWVVTQGSTKEEPARKKKKEEQEILEGGDGDLITGQEAASSEDGEEEEEEGGEEGKQKVTVCDTAEMDLVSFRRKMYLAIQSSLGFQECAHKVLKLKLAERQRNELCSVILDCCAQQRTHQQFFGLLGEQLCMLRKEYSESFMRLLRERYDTIHCLETNKMGNVAKFFAHLLCTDSLPWNVLDCIKLGEETTTSSSRIFLKIFFQELCEYLGLPKLNVRLKDETLQQFLEGLLPRDNPQNTRFAINFFHCIGLGGLTDELREHLKNTPKAIIAQKPEARPKEGPLASWTSASSLESDSSDSDSDSSWNSSASFSDGRGSSSSSSQSSAWAKNARKMTPRKALSEEAARDHQTCDRRQGGGREEQR